MTFFSANVGYVLLVSKRHTWNITLQRTLGNACLARCSENETKNSSTGGDGMGGRRGRWRVPPPPQPTPPGRSVAWPESVGLALGEGKRRGGGVVTPKEFRLRSFL